MLSVIIGLNDLKPCVPGAVLSAASVPFFVAAVGWGAVSRILPRKWYAFVDDIMYSGYQRLMLLAFENISGVTLNLYGDTEEAFRRSENVLYFSNHQSALDWALVNMLAIRQGSLGHLRYVLKDSLQYVPLYGYYFYMHGCVYVRRQGNFQADAANKQLTYVAGLQQPTWLVIFPEGTRYYPDKSKLIKDSRRYAKEIGFKELDHVLMPRIRGAELILTRLRHKLDAIYDTTIIYSESVDRATGKRKRAPGMFDFVCCPPNAKLHIHIKRIPIDEVPVGSEALRKWLYQRFHEKDLLLDRYFSKREDDISKGKLTDDDDAFPNLKRRDSCLPLRETLPPFLVIAGIGLLPFVSSACGRRAFFAVFCVGSACGMLWMKIKKVA